MSYSYGERDSFDSFAAMADPKYSIPEHHVVYDYCKNSEPWTTDVFALVFFDNGIYNSVHYTYYGPGTNKNFKLIGTLDKVMIGNKTYVADDRECYKIDRLLFGEVCSRAMAEDYVGHILNEDKIYWYQSTIKESEYGPVANYYKKTQDKSNMSLISDIDLNTDRIKKVYVFDIEGKCIGELIFDYINECPVIVEDRKSQMSIEQAQEIADNFKVYADKLRGETYGEN